MKRSSSEPFPLEGQGYPQEILDNVAYHVSYDWGEFQVTRAAKEAYGLVPLTADAVEGASQSIEASAKDTMPSVNAVVLGPDETLPNEDDPNQAPTGTNIGVYLSRDRIDLTIGFGAGVQDLTEQGIERIKGLTNTESPYPIEDEDLPAGPHGEPAREVFSQELPQLYAHAIANYVSGALEPALQEYLQLTEANAVYKQFKGIGRRALLTSGALTGSFSLLEGRLSTTGLIAGGATLALGLSDSRSMLRGYLRNRQLLSQTRDFKAGNFAYLVGESIHQTYCRSHFEGMHGTD